MNQFSRWVRDNLLIVICAAVMLLSVVALFWPIGPRIADFRETLAEADARLNQIQRFTNQETEIPSEDPGEQMQKVRMTVNENAVDAINAIYQTMTSSYERIRKNARDFNRGPNRSFIRPDLFPTRPSGDGSWRPSNTVALGAIEPYRQAFHTLYRRLNAGTVPTEQEIAQRLQEVQDRFEAETVAGDSEQSSQLERRKALARKKLFIERARTLSVYAEPPGTSADNQYTSGVFQSTRLATRVDIPPTDELWKSQMQLWIQQDLVDAIVRTNTDPTTGQQLPVTQAPVKRIIELRVASNYLKPADAEPARGGTATRSPEWFAKARDEPLPLNFRDSPTGRLSNPLYDVWLANIRVVIDSNHIPRFLNQFGRTNFITPIHRRIQPLDPSIEQQFQAGYVYGDAVDLVELSLQLETLWLRTWTVGSYSRQAVEDGEDKFGPMPDSVRVNLGIPPRDENYRERERETDGRPERRGGRGPEEFRDRY